MSPVAASMYCSPHPAALHIAPAAGLREFGLYDFAPGVLFVADCELAEVTARCNFLGWTAVYHAPGLTWQGMKLKNIIPQRCRYQIVRQFGAAKLIRWPNGQHELVGGTDTDRANALEWSSFFAHEIVFTHFHRVDHARNRPRKRWFAPRLQPAL